MQFINILFATAIFTNCIFTYAPAQIAVTKKALIFVLVFFRPNLPPRGIGT